jgi:O-antigen ligase
MHQVALWSALGSAAAAMASIAVSQILLGVALLALLASGRRWQWPPPSLWLGLFAGWTLLALAFSPEPAAGLPQVRKFYVLLAWPLLCSVAPGPAHWRGLALSWVGLGTLSALWGIQQFARKWMAAQAAGQDFYLSYVAARITGFNSHWMTFSGQLMLALLIGVALLLWGGLAPRWRWAVGLCLPWMGLALALALTRGVWIATACALVYLLWQWRRRAVFALAALTALLFAFGPSVLRERAVSMVRPKGTVDSNSHRVVTFRTGVEMIRAHPLVGVGPERVGRELMNYVPKELLPLPEGYYAHLHNIYVHYWAERGLPAMLGIVLFLATPLVSWRRRRRTGSGETWILEGCTAVTGAILITGVFEHNLGDSEILMLVLSVVALGQAHLHQRLDLI